MSDYNRYSRNSYEANSRRGGSSRSWDDRVAQNSSRNRSTSSFSDRQAQSPQGTGSTRRVSDTGSYRRVSDTGSYRRIDGTGSHRRLDRPEEAYSRRSTDGGYDRYRRAESSNRGYGRSSLDYDRNSYSRNRNGYSRERYGDRELHEVDSHQSNNARNSKKSSIDVGKVASSVFDALSRFVAFVFGGLVSIAKRSKLALAAIILVALIVVGGVFDSVTSIGKVHGHVVVGDVKAKGLTKEELAQTLQKTYEQRLNSGGVTIYASEEALSSKAQNPEDNGDLSVEQGAKQTVNWTTDRETLQAVIDYNALAEQAFEAGRGGIFDRISLFLLKRTIPVEVHYNEASLENLASNMDLTLGHAFVSSEVTVEDGKAKASKSKDGMMVDRDELKEKLTECFTSKDADNREFVEVAVETPAQITTEEGQAAADKVNAAIANGAKFTYAGESWTADKEMLGSWVGSHIIEDEKGEYQLVVYFDPKKAQPDISEHAKAVFPDGDETVSFAKKGNGEIVVKLAGSGTMPQIGSSISKLNDELFADGANVDSAPTIDIESTEVPKEMDFNEALNAGVITLISEYTTEYTLGAEERNHNIQLAADLLNNSICKANGGEWSFHETIGGECNEELGFKPAGSIVGGVFTDEIGGGICQVATTVFNAVYESGLPVVNRRNHTLYVSSYEPGRDAAVSWPDLDLVWANDTSSDILLKTGHTETSVSVYLYGVDPGYTVETETGEWEGTTISVIRKVYDRAGEMIREDNFVSTYTPSNELAQIAGTAAAPSSSSTQTQPEVVEEVYEEPLPEATSEYEVEGAA